MRYPYSCLQIGFENASNCPELDNSVQACINSARDLSKHLANAAIQQAQELSTATKQGLELVAAIRQQAIMSEIDRLHHTSNAFQDSIDHILEVKLLFLSYLNTLHINLVWFVK